MSRRPAAIVFLAALAAAAPAHASLFSGDTLDLVADILAWVVLIIAPVIGIGVFWIVHIMPEKIAEKRHHPQAPAIKTLCLLSLVFGGMLWPFAWLWAYSRPVFYKMAYGVDKVKPEHEEPEAPEVQPESEPEPTQSAATTEPPPRAARVATRERRPWEA